MRSRAYGSSAVKQVECQKIAIEHDGQDLVVGMDIGKYQMMAVGRWPDSSFDRPWRVVNPLEIPELVGLLTQLCRGRRLVVAMEPSGTYGDALRQALHDVGIPVVRIGTKVAHDYAEVFDGVPSQHDGKDAAVVAELAALGKGKNWAYESQASWEQELAYWVERLECYSRIQAAGLGNWGGPVPYSSHIEMSGNVPAGGNFMFEDGHVEWFDLASIDVGDNCGGWLCYYKIPLAP